MRKIVEARVLGPYAEENDRWRIIVLEKGVRRSEYLSSQSEARKRMAQLRKQQGKAEALTVGKLLEAFSKERELSGKVLPATSLIQAARVRDFLSPILEARVSSVTPISAAKLYADLVMKPNRVKGKPPSVATHRAYLSLAKNLFYWGVKRGIVTTSPFASVMAVGKPNAGKTQLRIEEARRFVRAALDYYESRRKPIAIAAVMALTMGLRASELLRRKVRDLDDGCSVLWIDHGKTRNAKRHLLIPEFIRPYLRDLIEGRGQEVYLFESSRPGEPFRHQVLWAMVQRLCAQAHTTVVCTHSLRGLYATLAVESGALSETVASSLGHGSFAMTERHYAQASSISNVKTARVDQLLGTTRTEESSGLETLTKLIMKLGSEQRSQLVALVSKANAVETQC